MTRGKRTYVLDTNVLMHDPTALFRFEEHDVFLPMTVLEELDAAKKGTSEVSRNARQVSRFINELIERGNGKHIDQGLELRLPQGIQLDRGSHVGRLAVTQGRLDAEDGYRECQHEAYGGHAPNREPRRCHNQTS